MLSFLFAIMGMTEEAEARILLQKNVWGINPAVPRQSVMEILGKISNP